VPNATAYSRNPETSEPIRAGGGRRERAMLSPEQDEEILQKAGFSDLSLFFVVFTWHG